MKLVFLTYINRSGSSYLAQQISRYDDIFVFPEGDALIDDFLINDKEISYDFFINLFSNDNKLKNWNFNTDELKKIINNSISKADIFTNILLAYKNKFKPSANILIFKKRDAFVKYYQIKEILKQDTKLISIIRDPRAIFFSQKKTIDPYTHKPFNINPLITAYYFNFYLNNMVEVNENTIIKYEDLVNNNEVIINEILEKISSKKNIKKDVITYNDLISKSEKKIHNKILLPPQKESINKWKNNLKKYEISIINNVCNDKLNEYNYLVESKIKLPLFWYYYFKLRIFLKLDIY